MKQGHKVGPVSDRPSASKTKPDRSKTGPTAFPRSLAIRNAHPRLKVPRGAVARLIALLDENFQILPADLPHLVLPRNRLAALKAGFGNPPSALRLPHSAVPPGELSLVFLTDPALAKIHADFMDDPSATDVITFEGDPAPLGSAALAQEAGLAGEICVSADTAWQYVGARLARARSSAGSAGLPPANKPVAAKGSRPGGPSGRHPGSRPAETRALQSAFATELTLYVVHGWLHLAGYDDLRPARKRRMRAAEARAMRILTAANAIPDFRLRAGPPARC